jgi:hypothetical protein
MGVALTIVELDKPLSSAAFGRLVGISRQRVDQLIAAGTLPAGGTAGQWLRDYVANLRELGGSDDPELAGYRRRLAKARAHAAEVDQRVRDGELINTVQAAKFIVDLVLRLRQSFRNLPPVLAGSARTHANAADAAYSIEGAMLNCFDDVTVDMASANCKPPPALALELARLRMPTRPTNKIDAADPSYAAWKYGNEAADDAERKIADLEAVVAKSHRRNGGAA